MCLSRPYPFKFFKACLPQVLLGPLLNTLSQMCLCFALTHLHEYFVQQDCLVMSSIYDFHIFKESIVNDRLIYLDTYFTSKALGRTLLRITWALIKKIVRKVKTTKSVRHVKVSQIIILFPNSFRNWSQKSFFFFCSN